MLTAKVLPTGLARVMRRLAGGGLDRRNSVHRLLPAAFSVVGCERKPKLVRRNKLDKTKKRVDFMKFADGNNFFTSINCIQTN